MRVKGEINQERLALAMKGREFFLTVLNADCDRVAVENPTPMKIVNLPQKIKKLFVICALDTMMESA